jgi:hypothetical protein
MKRSTAVARASRLGTVKAIHRQFDQLGIRRSDLFASLSLSVPVSLGLVPCTLSTAHSMRSPNQRPGARSAALVWMGYITQL